MKLKYYDATLKLQEAMDDIHTALMMEAREETRNEFAPLCQAFSKVIQAMTILLALDEAAFLRHEAENRTPSEYEATKRVYN